MSAHHESSRHPAQDPNARKSSGTMTGTLSNLTTGKEYPMTARGFYRYGERIQMVGPDPEGLQDSFEIDLYFTTPEPATGTHSLGGPDWLRALYWLWPNENVREGASGTLTLKNFTSTRHLEGKLDFTFGKTSEYRINVTFDIIG